MLTIKHMPIAKIKPNAQNARTHSKKQVRQIANSIREFGFVNPVLIDEADTAIAGHGRILAAQELGLVEVPCIVVPGLSDAKKRALMLADNKIAANAGWDREKLAIELPELSSMLEVEGIEISITGFEIPEIDQLITDFDEEPDPDNAFEAPEGNSVSQTGDIWLLGQHRLSCGNARNAADVERLMDGHKASMAFLDPPYNVAVSSIGGRGGVKHREFAEASGELSETKFVEFLTETLGNAAQVSSASSLQYVCMDWRHVGELWLAGKKIYSRHVNTAIWVKTNGGQGSFYRSAHEQIMVFQVGPGPHLNNIELGKHGRSRTNVWSYPGVNTFRKGRMDDLRVHPTVKPVALVADAMRDCTKRGDIVVDLFSGSGTTILAAERVGRRAYVMEIDPRYVDVAIRRWQGLTGKDAILESSSLTFEEMATTRKLLIQGGQ
jgi:DNA modification methylase